MPTAHAVLHIYAKPLSLFMLPRSSPHSAANCLFVRPPQRKGGSLAFVFDQARVAFDSLTDLCALDQAATAAGSINSL